MDTAACPRRPIAVRRPGAADIEADTISGVSGTPTVFIDGPSVTGARPFEVYQTIIKNELRDGVQPGGSAAESTRGGSSGRLCSGRTRSHHLEEAIDVAVRRPSLYRNPATCATMNVTLDR